MGKKSGILLFCILLGLQNLIAQSTTSNIEGWIFDTKNQPLVSANIVVTSNDLQGSRGTSTDERGYFRISSLPVGFYTVKISYISYQKVIINDVNLFLGQTTSLSEIHLQQSTIETQEVIVSAGNSIIDTRSAANNKSLTTRQVAQLPLERNYFHIAELLPHANVSYKGDRGTNFAGSTGPENRYFIDGSEVTGTENGILRFNLPYNFVRQVEVQTGAYQAEFQSALGGIINTVTYSGSNQFHGSLFGFFTNNNFSGTPRLSQDQPPQGNYADYDIGFGFGGPIVKDKLWYYAAYDPNVVSEDVYVNGLNNQNSRLTYHKFAGKLTWSANENNMITLSICGDPFTGRQIVNSNPGMIVQNPGIVNRNIKEFIGNASLKGIHKLGNNFILESSLSFAMLKANIEPVLSNGSEPSFYDYVTGTISGGQGFTQWSPSQEHFNGTVKGTWILPFHTIKVGVDFIQNSTKNDITWQVIEHYPDGPYYYDMVDEIIIGNVKSNNLSVFIQDSWQMSQRFCLNAGVRWDPQWLIASDGTLAQKITNQIQPRIGMVYQPAELGTQKITASYGRFYEPLLLSLSVLYHIKNAYWGVTNYPNDPRADNSGSISSGNLTGYLTNVPDLKGQYFDEFTVGYERLLSSEFKFGIRGIYRWLGQGIEDGVVSEADQEKYGSVQVYGNPGSGALDMLPKMKRKYTAIELTLQRFAATGFNFLASYVLSRNWGNYDGFAETYDATGGADIFPNNTNQFGLPIRMINSEGLLPNDRTHVFKIFGSYSFNFGLSAGMLFQWMSGTPLNELGVEPTYRASTFLQQRGTAGRTPSIWDLNFRFMYDISKLMQIGSSARIIFDVLHFASQRTILDYNQYHYFDYDQNYANPNYMEPVQFQPPMSVRLGMEVDI
jgi:Carboxypeptidase regulatory-like domain